MASMTTQFINAAADNLVASISLGAPKVNSAGGKSIDINNSINRKSVLLRLPKLKCWGVDGKEFDGKKKYSLGIAFPLKPTPESDAVIANLRGLDEFVKNQAIANSKDWFNKPKMSMDVVEALYTPCIRYSKIAETGEPNYEKPPSFNVKIPFWNDGRCDTEVYMFDDTLVFPGSDNLIEEVIPKGSQITALIQCGGIWFAGGKFGVTWKLKQACVQPSDYLPRGVNMCGGAEISALTRSVSEMPMPTPLARSISEMPMPTPLARSISEMPTPTEVALTVADSDDERDPEAEYSGDAIPVKGKRKVIKKSS